MAEVAAQEEVKVSKEDFSAGTAQAFSNPLAPRKVNIPAVAQPPAAAPTTPPVEAIQPPAVAPKEVAPNTIASAGINYDELTEDQRNEMLAKLTGGKIKSVKELDEPVIETAEEKLAKAQKKTQDALAWAYSNNKVKKEDYDTAVLVKGKTNREIALDLFTKDAREDNPKITAEEAEELFRDYYMEEAEDTDSRRKLRMKEMNRTADRYRNEATSNIDGLEAEYDSFQTGEQRYKAYGNQVDTVVAAMPKERGVTFTYDGPNNTKVDTVINYTLDDEDIKAIKKDIRSRGAFQNMGANEKIIKDKEIADLVDYHVRANVMDKVLAKVAADAAAKGRTDTEAYYKGIPRRTADNLSVVTEVVTNTKKPYTDEERKRFPKGAYQN